MARTKEFDEQHILNKAVDLFWMKGYNATSAQDLVEVLGISRSSLYSTYGDKHSLFIKALQHYRQQMIQHMINTVDHSEDVEQTIKNVFNSIKQEASNKNPKGCLMVNSAIELVQDDSKVAKIVDAMMLDLEDALCRAVKKGQDEGKFSTTHTARSLARFLMNSINGLRVAAKSNAGKKVLDDIVNISLFTLKQ
jgi:TetR/AcrR family transcriptional regulator, transcriptional repressor for nem operon